jgi:putative transposase
MLEEALELGVPEIYNTDQGSQFACNLFRGKLLEKKIKVSTDSKGRALDNIFVERLWQSVKYEEVYIKDYKQYSFIEAMKELKKYLEFYNKKRLHKSLSYSTPYQVHYVD